jgi:hypothetical protein
MKTRRDLDQYGRELKGSDQNPNHWTIGRIRWTGDGSVTMRYHSARKLSGARYVLELSAEDLDLILASREAVA